MKTPETHETYACNMRFQNGGSLASGVCWRQRLGDRDASATRRSREAEGSRGSEAATRRTWQAGSAAERRGSEAIARCALQGQQSDGRALLLGDGRRADRSNERIRTTHIFFIRNKRGDLSWSLGWSTAYLGAASGLAGTD
jgi:hypothetical protein